MRHARSEGVADKILCFRLQKTQIALMTRCSRSQHFFLPFRDGTVGVILGRKSYGGVGYGSFFFLVAFRTKTKTRVLLFGDGNGYRRRRVWAIFS